MTSSLPFTAYPLSGHCLFTTYSLPIHYLFMPIHAYSLPIQMTSSLPFTVYALSSYCLFTAYPSPFHCLFIAGSLTGWIYVKPVYYFTGWLEGRAVVLVAARCVLRGFWEPRTAK
jgi:hypothetical protein